MFWGLEWGCFHFIIEQTTFIGKLKPAHLPRVTFFLRCLLLILTTALTLSQNNSLRCTKKKKVELLLRMDRPYVKSMGVEEKIMLGGLLTNTLLYIYMDDTSFRAWRLFAFGGPTAININGGCKL